MLHAPQQCKTTIDSHFPQDLQWVLSPALTASGSTGVELGLPDALRFIAQAVLQAVHNKISMRCCSRC